ncbi:PorT family protein [Mucilaginibacter sp. HMF5004]|uniref:outer membrane beta-barrel protein n=1 Tax=Mucilaginibacter rivuli TaxID=2857527 RepID=UPI001C60601C|nr:PorT family protein [Mucilaginibacter rivuli]MBW4890962.1 PorT family protein [Mucilaginibacter rivuli]
MKRLIITAILCGMLGEVFAQQKDTTSTSTTAKSVTITIDSVITTKTKKKNKSFSFTIGGGKKDKPSIDSLNRVDHSGVDFDFSLFSHYSLGLANLLDNGSFTLSPKNEFLNYTALKTSYDSFEMFSFGYRFNNHFKINLAAGFDWTLIRLQNNNISIVADAPTLTYKVDATKYSKNRFSSNYLILPLDFSFRTNMDKHRKRISVEVGPEVGFLVDGMLKQISDDHGKVKNFNDFHFAKFKYGAFTRIGYGDVGIFAKYNFNDMFVNSPDQKGLKSFVFGVTFGFD